MDEVTVKVSKANIAAEIPEETRKTLFPLYRSFPQAGGAIQSNIDAQIDVVVDNTCVPIAEVIYKTDFSTVVSNISNLQALIDVVGNVAVAAGHIVNRVPVDQILSGVHREQKGGASL